MRQKTECHPAEPTNRFSICLGAALILATLTLFCPVAGFEFINYDDPAYVTQNTMVQTGLNWDSIRWAFQTNHASNWHPLTWLSHMLDWQLFGSRAGGHHLTNVLLHALNSLLLFALLKRLTGAIWRSAIVAALFAWHPLHVESVAWVAERKDVLSALFWMLTSLFYARYVQAKTQDGRRAMPARDYLLALLFFALGLMSKPMLVTLPFVLLLLDYWPLQRGRQKGLLGAPASLPAKAPALSRMRPIIIDKIPFLLLAAASSIVTLIAQKQAARSLALVPFDYRLANASLAYLRYLGKLLWPSNLAVFYPMPDILSLPLGIAGAIGLAGLTITFLLQARKRPHLIVGWLWFVGALIPVIGLVQVGAQSMADRYSYLPAIGVFIMLVWTAGELAERRPLRRIISVSAAAILCACLAATALLLPNWRNSSALFRHALLATGNNFVANINLASSLMAEGKLDQALAHYNASLQTTPAFEAYTGIAAIYEKQGKIDLAIEQYRNALQIQPRDSQAHDKLGVLLSRTHRYDEAVAEYAVALQLNPQSAESHYNLAIVLGDQNKTDEAVTQYLEALRLKPAYADAHNNLAVLLAQASRWNEAAEHLNRVIELRPNDAEAHFNLGYVLSKTGRMEEAKKHHDLALKLNPDLLKQRKSL